MTDTKALSRVLDGMGMEYEILSATGANVFARPNVSELARALEKENCQILSMRERDESLESYYVSLVGGGKNA